MNILAAILTPILCAQPLPRATPESQGVPSEAVSALIDRLEEQNGMVHSYMLIRHGKVIAEGYWEPFNASTPHALYSVSKSFVSMAIGFAVNDRLMSLDDRVVKFFPEEAKINNDERLKDMRVRDLMSMASGQKSDTSKYLREAAPGEAAKAFFAMPMKDEPGKLFRYMSGNTAMLALIHAKVTGEKDLIAYLKPRVFDKLGITSSYWPRLKDGTTVIGGSGFELKTEELAKICLLLLNNGVWRGERILPLWWVRQATSLQTPYGNVTDSVLALHGAKAGGAAKPDDWQLGYGWQLWMGHHESFRLCGAFGQIGSIVPDKDIIFVSNAGGRSSNKPSLNAFYDTILPALSDKPLKENPSALKKLRDRSAKLIIAPLQNTVRPSEAALSAFKNLKIGSTNALAISSIGYDDKAKILTVENGFGIQSIRVGDGEWASGKFTAEKENTDTLSKLSGGEQPVATSGGWTSPDRFTARIHFIRSPAYLDITFEMLDGEVTVSTKSNMSKAYTSKFNLCR